MNSKIITPTSTFRLMHYIMLQAVVSFALAIDNLGITNSIPAFKTIIDKLKAKLAIIAPLLEFNSRPLSGFARRRKQLKTSISQSGSIIMNAVYNYAVNIGDTNLQNIMRESKSGLFRLDYTHLTSRMNDAISIITPLLPNLANYDITEAQITALQTDVNEMISISPKNIYATRNANKREIQKVLRECMAIIYNEGDRQAQSFQKNNFQYFQQYVLNRKLYPNSRHTKFRVHVTDELNQPIPNVKLLQNGTTNFNDTDINGDATLYIKIEEGKKPLYNFTISQGTQSIKIGPVQIKKGETVTQTIIIQPTGFIIPENTEILPEKVAVLK
jgi:hypothetical protein